MKKVTIHRLFPEYPAVSFLISDNPYDPRDIRYTNKTDFQRFILECVLVMDCCLILTSKCGNDDKKDEIIIDVLEENPYNVMISFLEKYGARIDEKKTINT